MFVCDERQSGHERDDQTGYDTGDHLESNENKISHRSWERGWLELIICQSSKVRPYARRAVGCIVWLGDGFILHHQNSPAALSGHSCARGSAHPTYYCRADSMYRQLDCPPPRKGSCLL